MDYGFIAIDQQKAVDWARKVLSNPHTLILDTETTGLDSDAQIVQIAVCDLAGNTRFNSLVKPTIPIAAGATRIHGITDQAVADAPAWPVVAKQLTDLILGSSLIIYNADYDVRLIRQTFLAHQLTAEPFLAVPFQIECAMHWYSQWVGDWSDWHGNYRWQRLPGGDHSALGDCRATLEVIKKMAGV